MATEIRFAFALNGGVSLAIWIGGVVDEVLRFVEAGKRAANGEQDSTDPYIALCREFGIVPKVDVLAGSSAGGLNAAFLGAAIVHGCPNLQPIKQLWLDHGSFDRLLRLPSDPSLISVLNGDDELPAPHRGRVPVPRQERDRVRRRRSTGDRSAHRDLARWPGLDDQRDPRRDLLGRPPRRVRVQDQRLRLRIRRQGDHPPGAGLPVDGIVPRGVRTQHRPGRPVRAAPRHRAVRRRHHTHHPGHRRRGAREPPGAERDPGDHPPAVA